MADRQIWVKESVSGTVEWQDTKDSTFEETYKALGYTSVEEVMQQAGGFLGGTAVGGGKNWKCVNYSLSSLGGEAFEVTLHYESTGDAGGGDEEQPDQQNDPMKRTRSFDTGGGTAHINAGFEERGFAQGAEVPPDMKCAIGVDGDSIAGTDVVVPQLTFTETYEVPASFVTSSYINTLAKLTGKTNSMAWRMFAQGEALFLGCSGQHTWDNEKGDGPWVLSYKFAISRDRNPVNIGPIIGITKPGHDYLWAYYGTEVANNSVFRTPKYVYCTRVYEREDFSDLGIG